ncbi:IMPACT family protein [Bizionia sediminis]|uniref:IMPACT family protein n=1 Tax=Bizionia sediminis TaxID=1737064 RepID=A0ABW5KU18_9FLAO
MTLTDTYKTIQKASEPVLFKDKNSKFFGYAFPVTTEEAVKDNLDYLKKKHHTAGHWCYAYQLGTDPKQFQFRANDDGEPNNSAGMPIYGQIQSFQLTNILIVVVRYFGGVKLGVGGLINAYKTTSQMAIEASKTVTRTIKKQYLVTCDYKNLNKVMRIIKENNLKITDQTLALDCQIIFSVRLKNSESVAAKFKTIYEVSIKALN